MSIKDFLKFFSSLFLFGPINISSQTGTPTLKAPPQILDDLQKKDETLIF